MEGDSVPPPSDMEVGNIAPEAMPVKSLVDYSDSTSADVHHQDQDHYGGARQDDMDQETPSFSNGNGNGADEEQSKEMEEDAPPMPQEPKSEPFDVFGKMLSSMPAKPADEEEGADVKNEDGDANEEKKDTFDKMFDSTKPSDESEEKKDDQEDTKPEGEDSTKDDNAEEKKTIESEDAPANTTIAGDLDDLGNDDVVITDAITLNDKIQSDEKYYEEMKAEERGALEANLPEIDKFLDKLCCTVCAKKVDPMIGTLKGVLRHPHLGTVQCYKCREFYKDGDWPRTEDGDEYCRWCAEGGDILLCDKCPNAFCKKCLTRNLGARAVRDITKSEEWCCLLCDPLPIQSLKATYLKIYKSQDEIKEKRAKEREENKLKNKVKKTEVSKKEKDALVKSPKNFLEENISEAFKTLEVYQKALETERTRCINTVKVGMTVDTATSITRKLRKLYAVTQKNMDLLDRAIVESFVENFPTESTRIHMGRVAPAQPQYAAPAKRGARGGAGSKKKNIKQKLKIKPKKGKGRAPAKGKGKKGTIEINGAPDYVEYDLPSSVGKKKRKGYAESDVELIDVSEEDDEYYNPKKRSRPGPASSKKSKPGPASKKKSSYY